MSSTMMTHSMDGGVSAGDAVSADGLINLSALPCRAFDLFPEYIQDSADALRTLGTGVNDQVATMKTTWSGLSGCYEAPEQERVYALMDKPADAATDFKDRFDKAAGYLDTYAADLDTIKGELQHFESDTQKFINEALQGYNEPVPHLATQTSAPELEDPQTEHVAWNEHKEAINKNERLLGWYNQIIAKISKAASDCANGLNSLQMGSKEATVKPITLDELNQASEQGQMPWGAPVEEDKNTFELIVDGLIVEPVKGVGALAGLDGDPNTSHGETAKQAWKGLGLFAGGTVAALSPTTYLGLLLPPDSVFGGYSRTMLNSAATGWGGMIGWDHQAHLNGEDGWHKYKEDGVAATTVTVVGVGSLFTGVGAVASGTRTALKGGRAAASAGGKSTKLTKYAKGGVSGSAAAKVSTAVADLLVPGGGWVLSKGFRAFDMPDAPAMNPGSIADDLAESAGKGGGAQDPPTTNRGADDAATPPGGRDTHSGSGSAGDRSPADASADTPDRARDTAGSQGQSPGSAGSAGRATAHGEGASSDGHAPESSKSPAADHGPDAQQDAGVRERAGDNTETSARDAGSAGSAGRAAGHREGAGPEGHAPESSKSSSADHGPDTQHDAGLRERAGDHTETSGNDTGSAGSAGRASGHGEASGPGGRASETSDSAPAGEHDHSATNTRGDDASSSSHSHASDGAASSKGHSDGGETGSEGTGPSESDSASKSGDSSPHGPEGHDAPEGGASDLGSTPERAPRTGTEVTQSHPGTYDPTAPVDKTVSARHADQHFSTDDVQRTLDEAPQNAHGQPVDHRNGKPLLLEDRRGNRGWVMKWDAEHHHWAAENRGLDHHGMEATGEPGSFGYDDNGNLLPYANHRPDYAPGQVEEVWNASRTEQLADIDSGRLRLERPGPDQMWVRTPDSAKGPDLADLGDRGKWKLVEWHPGEPRKDLWDMGHRSEAKYSDLRNEYLSGELGTGPEGTEEFLRQYRDISNYQVEHPARNSSHVDE